MRWHTSTRSPAAATRLDERRGRLASCSMMLRRHIFMITCVGSGSPRIEARWPVGVRHPMTVDLHRHHPARPREAQRNLGFPIPWRSLRSTVAGGPAAVGCRVGERHGPLGDRAPEPSRRHRPLPPRLAHSDATVDALDLDSQGYVPWWNEQVPLFIVMAHCLSETTRHAGHADILREGLDGAVGDNTGSPLRHGHDPAFW
jgi:Protein of unknown function (DUF664)